MSGNNMPISADVLYTYILSRSPPLDRRSYAECLAREEKVFNEAVEAVSKKDGHVVLADFTRMDICGNDLLLRDDIAGATTIINYKTGAMIRRTGIIKANSLYIIVRYGDTIFVEDLRYGSFFLMFVTTSSVRVELEGNYLLMICGKYLLLINLRSRMPVPVYPYVYESYISVQLVLGYLIVVSKKINIYKLQGDHIVSHLRIPIFDTYPISYSNVYVLYVCDSYVVLDLLQENLSYERRSITTSYTGKLLVFIVNPHWPTFVEDNPNVYFNILGSGVLIGFITTLTYVPKLLFGGLSLKFVTGESLVNLMVTRRGYHATTLFKTYGAKAYNHNGNFIGKSFTFRRKVHTAPILKRLKFLSYGDGNPTLWIDKCFPGELRGVG